MDGADAEKLADSEKTDGVGDEVTELVCEVTGDRTIGDGGSTGAMRVGPGLRTLPLPESGDGLFGVVIVTVEALSGVALMGMAFDGVAFDGVAFAGIAFEGVAVGKVAFNGVDFDGVAFDGVGCASVGLGALGGCSFGDVVVEGVKAEKWVGSGGCASSLRESGDGLRSVVVARRTRDGRVFLLLNRGDGLFTMSELN